MSCGCNIQGVMNTPADHLARARALEAQGNLVEARRHVAMARQSINALRGLGVAADATAAPASGGLTDAQKAELREKLHRVGVQQQAGTDAVTRQIANIARIVTSVLGVIFAIPNVFNDNTRRDITRILGWVQALFSEGNRLPPMGADDISALRAICTFWSGYGSIVEAGINTAESAAYLAVSVGPSATGRLSDLDAALYSMAQYMARVLNGWCGDSAIRALINPPPPPAPPSPPFSLRAQARLTWNNARVARLSVEEGLRRRLDRPFNAIVFIVPDYATAQRIDCSTSAALLAAETALVELNGSVPAAGGASGTPASTVARSYFVTPPAASCGFAPPGGGPIMIPPPDGGGPIMTPTGGGGGGGAGIAIAGAGLLAALMMFRR